MKRVLLGLSAVVGAVVLFYAAWWGYWILSFRQHLPVHEVVVDDVRREYHLFVPETEASGSMPLLVLLQGGDAGSWPFAQQDRWEALAESEGFLIGVPVGYKLPENEGAWQLNTGAANRQDIDFMQAMIDDIVDGHEIDRRRVYAVGYSLGSMFSYELACQMSARFAAIASHAGTMPIDPEACDPSRNVPLLHIHGARDPIIAYGNSWNWKAWDSVGAMRDVPSLIGFWADRFRCSNSESTVTGDVTHTVHSGCAQGARVEHYRLETLGHEWPESINGTSTHEVLWSFLTTYRL